MIISTYLLANIEKIFIECKHTSAQNKIDSSSFLGNKRKDTKRDRQKEKQSVGKSLNLLKIINTTPQYLKTSDASIADRAVSPE